MGKRWHDINAYHPPFIHLQYYNYMTSVRSWIHPAICLLMAVTVLTHAAQAQDSLQQAPAEAVSVQNKVEGKQFTFIAQSITPQRGGFRHLTTYFDLKLSGDTLVSNLPYFGRAYTAPINPAESGLVFTSTSFDYAVKAGKKGSWDVSIRTKDQTDNKRMLLTVQENGNAFLNVTSNNRAPVSFNGYVKGTMHDN
jgi:hypothetical protein